MADFLSALVGATETRTWECGAVSIFAAEGPPPRLGHKRAARVVLLACAQRGTSRVMAMDVNTQEVLLNQIVDPAASLFTNDLARSAGPVGRVAVLRCAGDTIKDWIMSFESGKELRAFFHKYGRARQANAGMAQTLELPQFARAISQMPGYEAPIVEQKSRLASLPKDVLCALFATLDTSQLATTMSTCGVLRDSVEAFADEAIGKLVLEMRAHPDFPLESAARLRGCVEESGDVKKLHRMVTLSMWRDVLQLPEDWRTAILRRGEISGARLRFRDRSFTGTWNVCQHTLAFRVSNVVCNQVTSPACLLKSIWGR